MVPPHPVLWDGEDSSFSTLSDSPSVLFFWLSLNWVSRRTTIYPTPHLPSHLLIFLINLLFSRSGKWWSILQMAVSNPQLSPYLLGSSPPTCWSYFHCSTQLVRILYNPHPIAQACKNALWANILTSPRCPGCGSGVAVHMAWIRATPGPVSEKNQATWFFYLTLEMSTASSSMLPSSCNLVSCLQGPGKAQKLPATLE